MGQKFRKMEDQKQKPGFPCNQDFAKEGRTWIKILGAETPATGSYGDVEAKPPGTRRVFVIVGKNSNFNAIWIIFHTFLEPFVITKFLRFESQLKNYIVQSSFLLTDQF